MNYCGPDCDSYPIVDPRGLVTPFWDGWSLDAWIVPEDAEQEPLIPSRLRHTEQQWSWEDDHLSVKTRCQPGQNRLDSEVTVRMIAQQPVCQIHYRASTEYPAYLVLALRPYNPEGISFVHRIELDDQRTQWTVNRKAHLHIDQPVERHVASAYQHGDVFQKLRTQTEQTEVHCEVGLATAAAMYQMFPAKTQEITVEVPLTEDPEIGTAEIIKEGSHSWQDALRSKAELNIPDQRFQFLYEAAVRTLVLLSPDWTYPGPFTYKRFWYRDAAFLVHGLLGANLIERAEQVVEHFPEKQSLTGYFHSQEGEWDTNGEALWTLLRFCELTGQAPRESWISVIEKGADWMVKKRLAEDLDQLHAGLYPPGFSAEHLGNVDYYYWDNFWNVAGLRSAAALLKMVDRNESVSKFENEADALMQAIKKSVQHSRSIRDYEGIPASPYRRMDAGAVGSIVAGYPLEILPAQDPLLLSTIEYLLEHCFVHGAFFQDMIHSGMNAYLTLHVAQVLLRAGDRRFFDIVRTVADLATETGQWPEAIHPHTKGGCMGDGQHGWAAAEWIMMMRSLFVQEESDRLVLAAGIPQEWLKTGQKLSFGPTPTAFGLLQVQIEPDSEDEVRIVWQANWHNETNTHLDIRLPGYAPLKIETAEQKSEVKVVRLEK
ncbi:MAG: hypothetical protein RBT80_13090 [Candidatus Vecturithrix sp.]|nr:hypothetical protein [Candidatus Vecturithrix sp.]